MAIGPGQQLKKNERATLPQHRICVSGWILQLAERSSIVLTSVTIDAWSNVKVMTFKLCVSSSRKYFGTGRLSTSEIAWLPVAQIAGLATSCIYPSSYGPDDMYCLSSAVIVRYILQMRDSTWSSNIGSRTVGPTMLPRPCTYISCFRILTNVLDSCEWQFNSLALNGLLLLGEWEPRSTVVGGNAMESPYDSEILINGHKYFSEPYSLPALDFTLQNGMLAVGVMALLSVVSCIALISFIIWRFITWRDHYKSFIGKNSILAPSATCYSQGWLLHSGALSSGLFVFGMLAVGVMALLSVVSCIALISFIIWRFITWRDHYKSFIGKNSILAPSATCYSQGWLLHSGALSSGLFVLAIALHTTHVVVYNGRISTLPFLGIIVSIWVFAYLLTGIGLWLRGEQYFVSTGAWCWVSSGFQEERLALHYVWIFIIESGTILAYIVTFVSLRRKSQVLVAAARVQGGECFTPNMRRITAVKRIAAFMVLYPCVYVLLTLPLSAGRMWSMTHNGRPTGDTFTCAAGALLTSCGWVDCFLYTITRRRLLSDRMPEGSCNRSRPDSGVESLELGGRQTSPVSEVFHGRSSGAPKPKLEATQIRDPREQAVHRATAPRVRFASRHVSLRPTSPTSSIIPNLLDPSMICEGHDFSRYKPEQHCQPPISKGAASLSIDRNNFDRKGRIGGSWDSDRSYRLSFDEVETALPSLPARAR
nr:hypothetical protein CFP56_20472 [Quercus suber]